MLNRTQQTLLFFGPIAWNCFPTIKPTRWPLDAASVTRMGDSVRHPYILGAVKVDYLNRPPLLTAGCLLLRLTHPQ